MGNLCDESFSQLLQLSVNASFWSQNGTHFSFICVGKDSIINSQFFESICLANEYNILFSFIHIQSKEPEP
jgi:hypothetical protein